MDERPSTPYPPYKVSDVNEGYQPTPPVYSWPMTNQDSFYSFKLRDILEVLVIIGLGVGFLLTQTGHSTQLETNMSNLTHAVEKLTSHVEDIDIRGTQSGQSFQNASRERNQAQDRRIDSMEAKLADVIPDLREIKTKINFIAASVDEKKIK